MKKSMKNLLPLRLLLPFLIPLTFTIAGFKPVNSTEKAAVSTNKTASLKKTSDNEVNSMMFIYDSLQLDDLGLSKQAFTEGLRGYNVLRSEGKLNNDNVISIADFTLPSTQKRLFVIDLANHKLLFNTYVAHGRNSGKEYANRFSNSPDSHMSSLGFYVTLQTYYGEHGLSLRLEGEEKGINDNAESRAIVIHPADYVSENTVRSLGFLGRSFGCPALPSKLAPSIIKTIKDGSCFFVYSNNQKYFSRSQLLQSAS
ncbi:MAG: murein L,D-transpeptidase catalytic domain family protein [Ginsengibacter sp.]